MNILIFGSSGHAQVVIDIVHQEGKHKIVGLLDNLKEIGEIVFGYKILGCENTLNEIAERNEARGIIVAIGDNFSRSKVVKKIRAVNDSLSFITTIHPKSYVAENVVIGQGTVVMAGASINPGCNIGNFCIVNTNASIDHNSTLYDFSSLAPNSATGGSCIIGAYSALSINSCMIHGVSIGENTVIGAGSVVLKDIGSLKVAYGTPAKIVSTRKAGDKYL